MLLANLVTLLVGVILTSEGLPSKVSLYMFFCCANFDDWSLPVTHQQSQSSILSLWQPSTMLILMTSTINAIITGKGQPSKLSL